VENIMTGPDGLAVDNGLPFSRILMLSITPVFCLYMEGLRQHLARLSHARARTAS
jgi:hypothetical protein